MEPSNATGKLLMKTSAIVCAVLASTLGLGAVSAHADPGRRDWDDRRGRHEQRLDRFDRHHHLRAEHRDWREDRRDWRRDRREWREDRREWREERRWRQAQRERWEKRHAQRERWEERHAERRRWEERRAWREGWQAGYHQAPRYVVPPPRYHAPVPRFHRGGYLPYEYRQRGHYVDWHAYPGLYAPPAGHQWVNVGGDFLLVALATGLIVNLLMH